MTDHHLNLPPLTFRASVGSVDADKRTARLTFTTGADVLRFDEASGRRFYERLSLKAEHVDLERLNSGAAPLLDSHSAYSLAHQIGVVERAALEGAQGVADVRFSKRVDVEPIFQDVRDKIIRNVSTGYRVHQFEELPEKRDGHPVLLATRWQPFEISIVPMGADPGAQIRGGARAHVETNPCTIVPAGAPVAIAARAVQTDEQRNAQYRELVAIGWRRDLRDASPFVRAAARRRLDEAGIPW